MHTGSGTTEWELRREVREIFALGAVDVACPLQWPLCFAPHGRYVLDLPRASSFPCGEGYPLQSLREDHGSKQEAATTEPRKRTSFMLLR